MKNFRFSSEKIRNHAVLRNLLVVTCALCAGLSATTAAVASETRSCDWSLFVNNTHQMSGTASGSAATVFLARKKASANVLACFDKAKSASVPYCAHVTGWNKSFSSMLPSAKGKYEYQVNVTGNNGSGCTGSKSYSISLL
jgi:hypothetical protein